MTSIRRGRQTNRLVMIIVLVALLAVTGVVVLRGSSTPKSTTMTPTAQVCTALANIAAYDAQHPPKHTYPDLDATLTYDHGQFAAISAPAAAVKSAVTAATKSSQAMIDVVGRIMKHATFTKAQDLASYRDITVWKKARASLATWRKTACG